MAPSSVSPYQRILLKLSGEALSASPQEASNAPEISNKSPVINITVANRIAQEIATITAQHIQVGIVIGGGNWFRGIDGVAMGLPRITSDYVGMLATVMNALVLRDILTTHHLQVHVMSAFPMGNFVEPFELFRARRYLQEGKVLIFAGGTGHPLVSTDAAASLRALEIEADILLKATSVDGIYSEDPNKNPKAKRHIQLSYQEVLDAEYGVMDLAAFTQCRDHGLPIRVFNIHIAGALVRILQGESIGTLVS